MEGGHVGRAEARALFDRGAGEPEFGSPKFPALPEALAVHYLDNLDAKLTMSVKLIEDDKDEASSWTNFQRSLDTKLFKGVITNAAS